MSVFPFSDHVSALYDNILFTADLYINNFVECKMFHVSRIVINLRTDWALGSAAAVRSSCTEMIIDGRVHASRRLRCRPIASVVMGFDLW
jgi:hypothetical protein